MEPLIALGLGSLKALVLLLMASAIALALRGRPARLRAVVWSTALVGSLLIPVISTVVPALPVEVPIELPSAAIDRPSAPLPADRQSGSTPGLTVDSTSTAGLAATTQATRTWNLPAPETLIAWIWGVVALFFLFRQGFGLVQMHRIIGRGRPVTRSDWLILFDETRRQIGCRRTADLVVTSEIDIPAVFGLFRPVIILPVQSSVWLPDRLEAVLQHETVHIKRFDWPLRIAARTARSIYWFNPLAWWAAQRLDLEQEMACDEEVLCLGSRASSYACHLLGIARTAVPSPAVASAGLAMARRSHLEERIMRILKRSKHRKVGLAVILPAVLLTAALVPALASVQPAEPAGSPRLAEAAEPVAPVAPAKPAEPAASPKPAQPASPALKAAIAEMEEVETRIEPFIDRMSDIEIDMAPIIETIEAIDFDIDHDAIARIESEMAPLLAQIEDIEIDMEPFHEQMEAMHETLETMTFHIDDGTLDEVQEQIHEQMESLHESLGDIHIDISAYQELAAHIQAELAPLHEEISRLTTKEVARMHEEMNNNKAFMELEHEQMILMQENMERIHEELAPFEEEMERMGARIEGALVDDVAHVLRSRLGPVASLDAPFREAAARIIDDANIRIHDDILEINASRSEVRQILTDLFAGGRVGTQDAFDQALEAAVDDITGLRIRTE